MEGDQTHKKKHPKVIIYHLMFFLKKCDQIVLCMTPCVKKGYGAGVSVVPQSTYSEKFHRTLNKSHAMKYPLQFLENGHMNILCLKV